MGKKGKKEDVEKKGRNKGDRIKKVIEMESIYKR